MRWQGAVERNNRIRCCEGIRCSIRPCDESSSRNPGTLIGLSFGPASDRRAVALSFEDFKSLKAQNREFRQRLFWSDVVWAGNQVILCSVSITSDGYPMEEPGLAPLTPVEGAAFVVMATYWIAPTPNALVEGVRARRYPPGSFPTTAAIAHLQSRATRRGAPRALDSVGRKGPLLSK